MRTEFALRFDYGSTIPGSRGPRTARSARSPARTWSCWRRRVPLRGEGLQTVGEFAVAAGETAAFSLSYAPSHQPLPPLPDPHAVADGDGGILARLVGAMPRDRRVVGGGAALADHAQGADLRADRRHRCGADDLAAGTARRLAQLGLPLLLAPRRDLHPAGPAQRRLLDGGVPLARLVAPGRGRQPEPDADHVRPGRRAAADGVGGAVAPRLRGIRSRSGSATALMPSCSSTSMAS